MYLTTLILARLVADAARAASDETAPQAVLEALRGAGAWFSRDTRLCNGVEADVLYEPVARPSPLRLHLALPFEEIPP